jgi:DNA-directed RNA polymerase specialized sigma24 family protein
MDAFDKFERRMTRESFEPYRRRLLGLAYRMLGSMATPRMRLQETYLRWHGTDRDNVSDPRESLMATTTRTQLPRRGLVRPFVQPREQILP